MAIGLVLSIGIGVSFGYTIEKMGSSFSKSTQKKNNRKEHVLYLPCSVSILHSYFTVDRPILIQTSYTQLLRDCDWHRCVFPRR